MGHLLLHCNAIWPNQRWRHLSTDRHNSITQYDAQRSRSHQNSQKLKTSTELSESRLKMQKRLAG